MPKLYDTQESPKKAFLISIISGGISDEPVCRELEGLAESLGLVIAAHEKIRVKEKNPRFGIGSGKAESLSQKAAELNASLIVLDWSPPRTASQHAVLKPPQQAQNHNDSLSPSQQRNWEELTGIPVLDRQELIIRIFADRASTREAELQVKLAELTYFLPRLTHKYIDLSRQRGGRYGTKGSGETKLETDRRKIENRIHQLEKDIEKIKEQRGTQRRQRQKSNIPVCAIVGYTNAGKSSLLNALTGAGVPAEDKLFCTLDSVTRRFEAAPGFPVLLTDTVGFIRNLPHSLIKAFRSTLEEASLSDLLIHILDASETDIENNYETTLAVLKELGAQDIPMITILNKIDRLNNEESGSADIEQLCSRFPDSIPVSVKNGVGLDKVKECIVKKLFDKISL